jgi:hypothetical protein
MRSYLVTLAAALSLVGFVAASAAGTAAGGSSGGGASAGASSGGGGGGGGHGGGGGGGGGGGAHGGGSSHGVGGYHGGGNTAGGYAGHASYTREGPQGSYRLVGYESAGLGRGGAAARDGQIAPRSTLVIGPRTGSAAAAKRVTDRYVSPGRPLRPKPKPGTGNYLPCVSRGGDECLSHDEEMGGPPGMPVAFCPPGGDRNGVLPPGCPESGRSTALPAR